MVRQGFPSVLERDLQIAIAILLVKKHCHLAESQVFSRVEPVSVKGRWEESFRNDSDINKNGFLSVYTGK
jgi:hypothetical protein